MCGESISARLSSTLCAAICADLEARVQFLEVTNAILMCVIALCRRLIPESLPYLLPPAQRRCRHYGWPEPAAQAPADGGEDAGG